MTYTLTIEQKPTYLHVVITGQNRKENVMHYMNTLVCECEARNCLRVLLEELCPQRIVLLR
jgi:hypothetical protein